MTAAAVKTPLAALLTRIPRGRLGQALRLRLITWSRRAPLPLAIARGDTVVQVGAVGDGELWRMLELVGRTGRVVVVEPFPDHVETIEARLRAEGIANVTVIGKGAWSGPGTQALHVHPQWSDSNIVLESGARHDRALAPEEYPYAVEIEVDSLDDLLASHGIEHCDFIKITVMGAELQVLAGMNRVLADRPTLWVKAHSEIDGRPANATIAALLHERGFRTVIVRGNRGPGGVRRPGDVYAMPAAGAGS